MPDGIDAYTAADGAEYIVAANEGDGRDNQSVQHRLSRGAADCNA